MVARSGLGGRAYDAAGCVVRTADACEVAREGTIAAFTFQDQRGARDEGSLHRIARLASVTWDDSAKYERTCHSH
jgi:hypothetical protein